MKPPKGYKCGICGAKGCKLWREYNYSGINLQCAPCAAKRQKRDISGIDENGMRLMPEYDWAQPDERTNQIGWMVPAVPTAGIKQGFWGMTSTPQDAYEWWRKLPTLPKAR